MPFHLDRGVPPLSKLFIIFLYNILLYMITLKDFLKNILQYQIVLLMNIFYFMINVKIKNLELC